jgi:hypothetical protein
MSLSFTFSYSLATNQGELRWFTMRQSEQLRGIGEPENRKEYSRL